MFLFLIFINNLKFSRNEELIYAQLYIRHGARSPTDLNERGEDFINETWTSPGELTAMGQRMEYILGLRNRLRYITKKYKFLSENFDPHELLVYSTDKNRTILSMASQLQGLYPISSKSGEILTQEQIQNAYPQVNVSCDEIKQEIENMKDNALPDYMTVIPIHTFSSYQKKIINFDHHDCSKNVRKLKQKNLEEKETIAELTENFNKNYSINLSKFYPYPEDYKYDFNWISSLCGSVICGYIEGRTMSKFFDATKIDKEILNQVCDNISTINCRDELYGDEKNEVILLESSPLLRDMMLILKMKK